MRKKLVIGLVVGSMFCVGYVLTSLTPQSSLNSAQVEEVEVEGNKALTEAVNVAEEIDKTYHLSKRNLIKEMLEFHPEFGADEIIYAVDNANIDFTENAKLKAEYYNNMGMQKDDIKRHLTASYEQFFTDEEAKEAILSIEE
jgi:hypothetical protein